MDHCVGRVLAALEESGQLEDTVIVYTSDHGDMMGDHGFWTKQIMYEASAGVPMIVAGPDIPVGKTVTTGASLLDLAATAVDVTGAQHDEISIALPGRSLRDFTAFSICADRASEVTSCKDPSLRPLPRGVRAAS